jgi:GAF domain-containing protein
MKAPQPANEAKRLLALERYRILNTAPERAYDDVTELACYICNAPIAFMSFIDGARQWFKSKIGVDAEQTSRDVAFCSHTVLGQEMLVVPDALEDERFANGPLTRSEPFIRFYAGMPLVTPDGYSVGALCVADREPRRLSDRQEKTLRALARQVVQLMELRRVSFDLAEALADIKSLKRLLPICAYCKRVRDDAGYWNELDAYLQKETGADFTHGICPSCSTQFFAPGV